MALRRYSRAAVKKKLKELGSLMSATLIVLGVCGVAVVSMAGARGDIPGPVRALFQRPMLERNAQAHLSSQGLVKPVVCVADVKVIGWRDRETRVTEITVVTARPVEVSSEVGRQASVSPAGAVAVSLEGRRVLASVKAPVADRMPGKGSARVRLVAVPQGDTVGLVIDDVLSGASALGSATVTRQPSVPRAAASTPTSTVTQNPAPVAESLSAYYGKPGARITLNGAGFGATQGASFIVCSGARAQVESWSDTRIDFIVPSEATLPGYVGVHVGGRSSNGLYFIPADRPTVASISPREGAPGTVVTISGRDFGAIQGAGWVSFAGATAEVVSWADDRIRVVVPKNAAAGWAGVVANGLSSNGLLYGPYGLPYVSGISTSRLTKGDTVVITGRDFGDVKGWVLIGTAKVTPTTWSDKRVTFTVPAGVRSGYLGILREDRYTSNGWWANLVPRMQALSSWWARPGSEITLTGIGFGSTRGEYRVTVGRVEVPDADIASWSDTMIRVRVPASAPSGYVGVGTVAACSNGKYLVVETPAVVGAVTPRTARAGDVITVTGSGFGPASAGSRVLIGGVYECAVEDWADGSARVRVPAGASSGYVGVIKQNVSSNGVWLNVAP